MHSSFGSLDGTFMSEDNPFQSIITTLLDVPTYTCSFSIPSFVIFPTTAYLSDISKSQIRREAVFECKKIIVSFACSVLCCVLMLFLDEATEARHVRTTTTQSMVARQVGLPVVNS